MEGEGVGEGVEGTAEELPLVGDVLVDTQRGWIGVSGNKGGVVGEG